MNSNTLLNALSPFLKGRTRVVSTPQVLGSGPVVYWMCTAVRDHDNPALDAARMAAAALNRPLLIYHGLSYRYPYASDRHHRLIMEGAKEVQASFLNTGYDYRFHLEHPGDPPVLKQLVHKAALVVTENMPTPPIRQWLNTLAAIEGAAIWAVDSACLVSLEASSKRYTRAFAFRDGLADVRESALKTPYPTLNSLPPPAADPDILRGIDLQTADINALIDSCPIDHTIPPVRDTPGGSRAGYGRWKTFLNNAIRSYHRNRNDPNRHGVSRMSAYLHYGFVSPFQLAQDADRIGGKGAEKFLDELLIWRELAWHWCDKVGDPGHWRALPGWARETLLKEADRPRPQRYSWEELARAQTDDDLWNLTQRSLILHGELHNNVRMTWGKAIHQWTDSPGQSFKWLIDLNHRFALDGRDPSSYGGLLWCLGLFDRPFQPEKPIFGTVRTRNSERHAQRLDMAAYHRHIERDPPYQTVAVVGGGLAGLFCARTLHDHRFQVTVFDKGRGPGGRASSRRSPDDDTWRLDHGLPYIDFKRFHFKRWVLAWKNAGILTRWAPNMMTGPLDNLQPEEGLKLVGTPSNSALAQHLAAPLTLQVSTKITAIQRTESGWMLSTATQDVGPFDTLVLTLPPKQLTLLSADWGVDLDAIPFTAHHTLMLRFDRPLAVPWDAAKLDHPVLRWACRENSKPGRPTAEQWVVHSQPAWSASRWSGPKEAYAEELTAEFLKAIEESATPNKVQMHRWGYSQCTAPLNDESWWTPEQQLGVCAGWLNGGGAEGAILSGAHLAGRILKGRP